MKLVSHTSLHPGGSAAPAPAPRPISLASRDLTPAPRRTEGDEWHLDVSRGRALLEPGQHATLWRICSGAFLVERPTRDGPDVVALALPGDLVGLEALLGEPCTFGVSVLLSGRVRPESLGSDAGLARALGDAVRQQQRQALEMSQLRSGPVLERLQHLLGMLACERGGAIERKDLPTLKAIARLVNSAPETVCRELNRLLPARPRPARKARDNEPATRWRALSGGGAAAAMPLAVVA
jgi:CRP-like cAMP-binding protein